MTVHIVDNRQKKENIEMVSVNRDRKKKNNKYA